ncbi:MAG TPA: trypsin-like serine protease [Gemmatimonadaceae bacterium]|nr:trypsin-like serine protease [Gemmatimonadaceae bacterium]
MRLARPLTALTLLVLVAAACTDRPASTAAPDRPSLIVNGQPTGKAYPSVGALIFDWWAPLGVVNGDDQWCTGSLISPTVFVTAAHCVVGPDTPAGTQFYVSFAPDLLAKGVKIIRAKGYAYDPLYGHDQANLHDLAVIFLPSSATTGMTPLQLPTAGELDQLAARGALSKTLFVNVGYGSSASRTGPPSFGWDGKRNTSKSEFMGLQPTWLGLLMNTSATGEGGDCYGDSGGPKFLDGNPNKIYATVTTGDYPCRATTWDWRLDTPEARAFLRHYVALP